MSVRRTGRDHQPFEQIRLSFAGLGKRGVGLPDLSEECSNFLDVRETLLKVDNLFPEAERGPRVFAEDYCELAFSP